MTPGIDKKSSEKPVDGPEQDSLGFDDQELIDFADDDEKVGLDDSEGFDGDTPLFTLDLPPGDAHEPDVSEADDTAIPIEGLDTDAEYGWSDDGSAETDESWDPGDFDMPVLAKLGRDDGGEEGMDEEMTVGGLPELIRGSESDDELAEDLLGDVADGMRHLESGGRSARELPSAADETVCQVSLIGPPCTVLSIDAPPPTLAGGAGIYGVAGGRPRALTALRAEGLDRSTVTSIVRVEERIAVGLQPTGAMFSVDGGETFAPASAATFERSSQAEGGFYIHKEASSNRLWGRTAAGALMRSDDLGATWNGPLLLQRVVALTTTERSTLAFSAGPKAASQLAITSDGGERWSAARGPAIEASQVVYIAAHRGIVVLSGADDPRGPFLSRDGGKRWARLPAMVATGPMALVREDDSLSLYAAHSTDERVVVARHRPDGGESYVVLDVDVSAVRFGSSDADPRTVHSVAASVVGSHTELFVATSVGLFNVRIESARIGELL